MITCYITLVDNGARHLDTLVHPVALVFGVVACAAIIVLGIRFFLQPRQATLDFGIAADSLRGLTEIKGARDITSGVVPLVVWASAGTTTLGWVLIAAAITPTADALIVLTNGGKLSKALGVHGLTAGLLVAAGLVLALG
jgi:Domain of unknown function (DUF4267)